MQFILIAFATLVASAAASSNSNARIFARNQCDDQFKADIANCNKFYSGDELSACLSKAQDAKDACDAAN
jgi:hypothetical protein